MLQRRDCTISVTDSASSVTDSASFNRREDHALNLIRVVCSAFVVIAHCFILLYYSESRVHTPILKALTLTLTIGHQALDIFFVLSGFWVGGEIISAWRKGRYKWSSYLTKRLVRIYVVLLPVLPLTYLISQLGHHFYPNSITYKGSGIPGTGIYTHTTSIKVFIENIIFLQPDPQHYFVRNYSLWSLTYEFWYYLWFPLMACIWYCKSLRLKALYAVLLVAAVEIPLHLGRPQIINYFGCWLAGCLLYVLVQATSGQRATVRSRRVGEFFKTMWIAVPVTLIVAYLCRVGEWIYPQHMIAFDYAMVPFAMWLVYACIDAKVHQRLIPLSNYATSTYSLYVVHLPLLALLVTALTGSEAQVLSATTVFYFVVMFLVAWAAGWLVSECTEKYTVPVRRKVNQILRLG